jgi:cysteine desulfurase
MIYFDNAAGAPPLYRHQPFFGNPSSPHAIGIQAERALRESALFFSQAFNCRENEIIFTSGGTESNNLAILGVANAFRRKGGVILASPAEHPSVLAPLHYLAENPAFSVRILPLGEWADNLDNCILASLSHVNHETGDIHDIAGIASMIKTKNSSTIVHVDGAQGFCKIPAQLENIDMYSWSAHKFHGPVGVGGLMARRGVRLKPVMHGGGQQYGIRPGTENIPGILSMTEMAKKMLPDCEINFRRVFSLKTKIIELQDELPFVFVNAFLSNPSPYILNMSFEGIKGEVLVNSLSNQGIYASMGAACRKNSVDKSPLTAMGFSKKRSESAVRFSFSPFNTPEEAIAVKEAISKLIKEGFR